MIKKLIAMDMDGTLTQHKSLLEEKNREALVELQKKYHLVMVGAGSCERIHRQMQFDGIDLIGYYGMQMMFWQDGQFRLYREDRLPVDEKTILEKMEFLRTTYGYEKYVGKSVEFHASGMVTLPLLGTDAMLADKLAFDPTREKRRVIYEQVKALFPDYTVFVGGTSSFDMAPAPYDKYYALMEYAKIKGYQKEEIVYVGDDYGIGGNDEQVYQSDITFLRVDDYREFSEVIKHLL
ncbi:MAG: HAD-IIB family hydrolase [Lachnospiraceae bacterium]|nr:HAD-IIB family hydrolase [Lachnospiraceae bacterium]